MADTRGPTLRSMTVADLVDEIFRLYRANFALFFGVSAIVWLPTSIVYIVLNVIVVGGVTPTTLSLGAVAQSVVVLGIAGVIAVLALPVLFGALTAAVSARHLAQPVNVDAAIRRALQCYWRVVAAYVLFFLALLGLTTIPFVLAVFGAISNASVFSALLAFASIIVIFAAIVWLTATWAFIGQAIVVEDVPVRRSFGRSRALASGSRWRVIGINLLLGLIQGVLFTVPTVVAVILAPLPGAIGPALSQLVTAFAQIAYYPVQLGTLTLLYYDLRVRKEALDLTLAAERLPAS